MKRREIRIMQTLGERSSHDRDEQSSTWYEAQMILTSLFDPEDDYGAFPTEMTFETIPEWNYMEREEELRDFYNEREEVI